MSVGGLGPGYRPEAWLGFPGAPAGRGVAGPGGAGGAGAPAGSGAATAEAGARRRPGFAADATLARVATGEQSIERGARGSGVVEVQRALLDLGYDLGGAGADGMFGLACQTAVADFQRRRGLAPSGYVDATTLGALETAARPDPRFDRARPLIGASVGPGQPNRTADVKAVQERLKDLGYYQGPVNGRFSNNVARSLNLFDAVVRGEGQVTRGKAAWDTSMKLDPGEDAERWLRARNGPRWEAMPRRGTGFVNDDRDAHGYGTSWLRETVERAGSRYTAYAAANPRAVQEIHINDASRRHGGDTIDHDTHETGLNLDVRLGRGNITHRSRSYDREATWASIRSFLDDGSVSRVLFNDPELLRRAEADPRYAGRLVACDGHDDHLHVEVVPPPIAER